MAGIGRLFNGVISGAFGRSRACGIGSLQAAQAGAMRFAGRLQACFVNENSSY